MSYHVSMRTSGPSAADVYVIVAGVLLGVLLGPGVLGRLAPQVHDRWFVGDGELDHAVAAFNAGQAQLAEKTERLKASGVTDAAVTELEAQLRAELKPAQAVMTEALQARSELQSRLHGKAMALLLAALALMVIEAIMAADSPLRGRLATARYAVLAAWLSLALARGDLNRTVPVFFLAAVLLVAIGVVLMPIGGRSPKPENR